MGVRCDLYAILGPGLRALAWEARPGGGLPPVPEPFCHSSGRWGLETCLVIIITFAEGPPGASALQTRFLIPTRVNDHMYLLVFLRVEHSSLPPPPPPRPDAALAPVTLARHVPGS